jgi:tripartite-type tricarboxylate transporter receptor subunit TctC
MNEPPDRKNGLLMFAHPRRRVLRHAISIGLVMLGAACWPLGAHAQDAAGFPSHPIRLVLPVPPAGAGDVAARAIGQHMAQTLKQQVIIDNRPGAGTTLGLKVAAKAAPDGYTIGLNAVSGIAIGTVAYTDLPDLRRDVTVIAGIADAPHMLVVPASLGVHNVAELIALFRKSPNQYNYASQGSGSLSHLESAMFLDAAHVQVQHVPYSGSSAAMPGLLSGTTSMMFDSVSSVLPQVKAGKLVALATTARHRVPQFPDAPTMGEVGVPGLVADNPFLLFAPLGTPPERVKVLTDAVQAALADPQVIATLQNAGIIARFTEPAAFQKTLQQEYALWPALARKLTVSVQ